MEENKKRQGDEVRISRKELEGVAKGVADKLWPMVQKEIVDAEERGYLRGLEEANKKSGNKTVRGRAA